LKAFLLAAGLGTRLRPLTDKIPKCLVPINGKPLLQIWLELCQLHRITEILINTHHLANKVSEFIDEYKAKFEQLSVRLTHEIDLLGSAGTLFVNREFVDNEKEFFILYADNLTNANLTSLIKFHRSHGELFTMGLFKTNSPTFCGIAELNEKGKVINFEEKPKEPNTNLAAAGIYIASPEIFKFFPNSEGGNINKPLDLGFHILPNLTGHMYGYLIDGYLLDIGDMKSYKEAQREWPSISSQFNNWKKNDLIF
jgi:mannose-1-phosphate guanylyltransferase